MTNLTDPDLRLFVQSLEDSNARPITLLLSSAMVVGVAVKRADFFDALRELAERTNRPDLRAFAMNASTREEPAGDFVHLLSAVVICGGQAVDSALTSPDRRTVDSSRPPMRVRVADVSGWHPGNVFEEAR